MNTNDGTRGGGEFNLEVKTNAETPRLEVFLNRNLSAFNSLNERSASSREARLRFFFFVLIKQIKNFWTSCSLSENTMVFFVIELRSQTHLNVAEAQIISSELLSFDYTKHSLMDFRQLLFFLLLFFFRNQYLVYSKRSRSIRAAVAKAMIIKIC